MKAEEPNPATLQIALALDQLIKTQNKPIENVAEHLLQIENNITKNQQQNQIQLTNLNQQLKNLESAQTLIETINETNRKLSDQFYDEQIIQPMTRSLFPLLDFTNNVKESLKENTPRYQLALQYITAIQTQLDQFLINFGIERFHHKTEEPFNPKIMKPLKSIITNDKHLNGLVAESLLCGFKKQERVLRLETVSLFKY
jgi:molecular chaperone GrpE (heat shock protein)